MGQYFLFVKLLKGFGNGIIELVDDYDGDIYCVVYMVCFEIVVYVLYSFKKKFKCGIKILQGDINFIK